MDLAAIYLAVSVYRFCVHFLLLASLHLVLLGLCELCVLGTWRLCSGFRIMSIGTEENEALQEYIVTFKVTVFRKAKGDRILFLEAEQDCVDTALQPAPSSTSCLTVDYT